MDPEPKEQEESPRRRRRRWAFRIGALLVVLLLAEVVARIGYAGRWPYHLVFDQELIWRHRPNWEGQVRGGVVARLNGIGLREDRELTPKAAGPRVLVMGDSIAFGFALKQGETISRRMEEGLRGAGRQVEVVNGGVSGYGTEQETVRLRQLLPQLQPDLVLLFFCMSNDVSVESIASFLGKGGLFGPGRKSLAVRSGALRFAFDHSAFAWAIGRWVNRRRIKWQRRETAARHGGGLKFSNLGDLRKLPATEQDAELAVLKQRLAAFHSAATAAGARCGLVVFGSQALIAPGGEEPVGQVVKLAREVGYPTLDLLPLYRAHPDDAPALLRQKDGIHPTADGAARIATHINRWLTREKLLDVR